MKFSTGRALKAEGGGKKIENKNESRQPPLFQARSSWSLNSKVVVSNLPGTNTGKKKKSFQLNTGQYKVFFPL